MKEKVPKGWISITEFEALTGLNNSTIKAAINRGAIPERYADRVGPHATSPYYLNPQQAALHWYKSLNAKHPNQKKVRDTLGDYIKNFNPDAVDKSSKKKAGEKMSMEEAIQREQIAKTEIAELKAAQLRGELVPREEIDQQLYAAGKALRDSIMAVPDRIADQLIAAVDNRTLVINLMADELSSALSQQADILTNG